MGGMGGGSFGSGGFPGMNGHPGGGMGGMGQHQRRPKKDAAHEMELQCTLEELYRGTTRRMKIRWVCLGAVAGVSMAAW